MGENLKMHYCGNSIKSMLPGWPVCGTGDFAIRTKAKGNQTVIVLRLLAKSALNL